ncbi:Scr1 family TA system antitoxin-like transcriptional regulator [Actinomadura hibisca]|uniref:Scr1 family TA system antitoxin-like transcriptional regulator n=1 Tax=Actinomadura hibisca TaxID=68565 RepID=UPI0008356CFF|nr:Scr1 family TA system antitoxin-like transcriptional regulator [Actinomadura hibisca]
MGELERVPNINARRLGLYLRRTRELVELSYDEAAAATGFDVDWLARVETGFGQPSPDEVERLLVRYRVRDAKVADLMIDLATRPNGPEWMAPLLSDMKALKRDALISEAEASVVRSHGFQAIPPLAQAEPYTRLLNAHRLPPHNPEDDLENIRHRQRFRAGGRTRFLDLIISVEALTRVPEPQIMAAQVRHLLELADRPDAKVRLVPAAAPIFEDRLYNFDVLEFPRVADRISLSYSVLGIALAAGDLSDIWNLIEGDYTLSVDASRDLLHEHLAELTAKS